MNEWMFAALLATSAVGAGLALGVAICQRLGIGFFPKWRRRG